MGCDSFPDSKKRPGQKAEAKLIGGRDFLKEKKKKKGVESTWYQAIFLLDLDQIDLQSSILVPGGFNLCA